MFRGVLKNQTSSSRAVQLPSESPECSRAKPGASAFQPKYRGAKDSNDPLGTGSSEEVENAVSTRLHARHYEPEMNYMLFYPAPPHDADGIAMHTPISPTPGANNSCYR